jgi:release factor glutamine methyltransferase
MTGNGKRDEAIPERTAKLHLPRGVFGTPTMRYGGEPEIRHMLRTVADALRDAGSPTPRLDAEVLLAHVLGVSRAQLYARLRDPWPTEALEPYGALLRRRLAGEPVAYLVGHKDFYGLDLQVDPRVLIPRPETEELVGRVLAALPLDAIGPVADIGTGSGAIAIALAVHRPALRVVAVDLSAEALDVARANAARYDVAERISWRQGDLLEPLSAPVAGIAANLPYTVLDEVDPDVREWEPVLALDGGGPLGTGLIARLLAGAPRVLPPDGWVALEIGYNQAAAVERLARAAFPTAVVQVYPDVEERDRVVWVQTADHAD